MVRKRVSYEEQSSVNISKETRTRLEDFRLSFRPVRFGNNDELINFMLDYLEKAIPDVPEEKNPKDYRVIDNTNSDININTLSKMESNQMEQCKEQIHNATQGQLKRELVFTDRPM